MLSRPLNYIDEDKLCELPAISSPPLQSVATHLPGTTFHIRLEVFINSRHRSFLATKRFLRFSDRISSLSFSFPLLSGFTLVAEPGH